MSLTAAQPRSCVQISINDDAIFDPNELFNVVLGTSTAGATVRSGLERVRSLYSVFVIVNDKSQLLIMMTVNTLCSIHITLSFTNIISIVVMAVHQKQQYNLKTILTGGQTSVVINDNDPLSSSLIPHDQCLFLSHAVASVGLDPLNYFVTEDMSGNLQVCVDLFSPGPLPAPLTVFLSTASGTAMGI